MQGKLLEKPASDVPDGVVGFLNALRVERRNIQQQIHLARQRPARLTRERHKKGAPRATRFDSSQNVCAGSTRGESHKNILRRDERFNLPGENLLDPATVSPRRNPPTLASQPQPPHPPPFL